MHRYFLFLIAVVVLMSSCSNSEKHNSSEIEREPIEVIEVDTVLDTAAISVIQYVIDTSLFKKSDNILLDYNEHTMDEYQMIDSSFWFQSGLNVVSSISSYNPLNTFEADEGSRYVALNKISNDSLNYLTIGQSWFNSDYIERVIVVLSNKEFHPMLMFDLPINGTSKLYNSWVNSTESKEMGNQFRIKYYGQSDTIVFQIDYDFEKNRAISSLYSRTLSVEE